MNTKGYTLLEVLVVLLIIGLLSVIVAPSWLSFWQRQQIRTAANKLYLALASAKSESRNKSVYYAVTVCSKVSDSGREEGIKYNVHPYSSIPAQFTKILNVSLVKSTVRYSPSRYNLSRLEFGDCHTSYLGLFPGDGHALGFFYISQQNSKYIHRVGFNTLIGNIASCAVVSLHKPKCK